MSAWNGFCAEAEGYPARVAPTVFLFVRLIQKEGDNNTSRMREGECKYERERERERERQRKGGREGRRRRAQERDRERQRETERYR